MTFSTRRGRPRSMRQENDKGTPELIAKRAQQITLEAIDLCLEKRIISPEQHRCGLHLRWLYTLRYGAPGISCRDITDTAGRGTRIDDPAWRESRELEYHEAITALHRRKRYECIMNLVVYNQLPVFMLPELRSKAWDNTALLHTLLRSQSALLEGFECLQLLWCKQAPASSHMIDNSATAPRQFTPTLPPHPTVFASNH
jgi:hypothetical protein